jgi:tetratricopeptide (TPR) repeat protein
MKFYLPIFIFLLSLSVNALTSQESLGQALKSFQLGSYQKALADLKTVGGNAKSLATRYYLEGVCHNHLQEYDLSLVAFSKARKYGSDAKDIFYEYGQALYANSELVKARKSFQLSYQNKYKASSSLYYMAHISQLLDEHKKAKDLYLKVIKTEKEDVRLVQVARFQLSESLLAIAEKRPNARKIVKKYVVPQLKMAYAKKPDSKLANEIQARRKEIEKRYFLDPNVMINGKILSSKRWSILTSQDLSYDNNVVFETQAPTAGATQSESYVQNTYLSGNYLFSFKNRYTMQPKLDFVKVKHTDRENAAIFQNDSYSVIFALNNNFEHKLFSKQATLNFDLSYTYYARDRLATQDIIFFSRSMQYTLGETFNLFSIGPTKIYFSYQDLTSFTLVQNYRNTTFGFDQTGITKKGHMWVLGYKTASFDNYNQTNDSTAQQTFSFNYYVPKFMHKTTLALGFSLGLLDTKEQSVTRGTEKNISPSISFIRELTKNVSATITNTYTRNSSLNLTSFDYKKNISSLSLSASF